MRFFGQALLAIIPTGFRTWRVNALFLATMLALSGCLQQEDTITDGAASFAADDGGVAVDDGGVAVDDGEAISVTGELTVLYMDDFDNKRAELQYFIEGKQSKKKYKLQFKDTPPGHLRTGTEVQIRGKAKGKEIVLAADGVDSSSSSAAPSVPAVTGEQRTLVMVANFTNATVSCPTSDISDLMFTDSLDQSIDDLYQETSFGAISLSGQVAGPYNINYTKDECEFSTWADAVDAAAQADGVNLAAYERRVYVMPQNACPAAGIGDVGGTPTRAWVFTCAIADVYAHELGHNFNMHHAATPSGEYGDNTDFMGLGQNRLRQVNAAHKEQMGWLPDFQTQLISQSGFYDIAPLELDAASALAPQALRIFKPDTNEYYYLSYRRGIGFDANLIASLYLDRLSVHRYPGDGSARKTYLLALPADGESFSDPDNGITVTTMSHNDDFVTVQVALDGSSPPPPTCTVTSPLVNLSPASQTATAGSNLDYTVNVTNQDSTACETSTFALTSTVPAGWSGTVSLSALSLSPGQSGTATFSVISDAAATAATYDVSVTATDNTEIAHTATGNGSYTIAGACTPVAPSLSVAPGSQNGDPGATLTYTVSLVNNDSADCSGSTFDLSVGSAPAGWTASLSNQSLTLAAGATGSASLSVTSSATAAPVNSASTGTERMSCFMFGFPAF